MSYNQVNWKVLLLGGASGVGKTTVAKQLGLELGIPWLHIDDIILAFQRSSVTLPEKTDDLYFFTETENLWNLSPERIRDGLINMGQALSPAIEVIIENHVDTNAPIIIEGDSILPSLFWSSAVHNRAIGGQVQMVILQESDEKAMLKNFLTRNRSMDDQSDAELHTEVHAKWLYGQWLSKEAQHYDLPTLEARPWISLAQRIMEINALKNL